MGLLLWEDVAAHHPSPSMQSRARMTELINLDRILYPEPVAAGMDPYVLMALTKFFRCANEHTTPVVVRPRGDVYELVDGRHRAVASMMAGRKQVLAEVQV